MTTTWKAHLNAYLLAHPRVHYKTAQKRASKTYQKLKKDGMAKTSAKSFFGLWGGKVVIDTEQDFRQYLEKHKQEILRRITPERFDYDYKWFEPQWFPNRGEVRDEYGTVLNVATDSNMLRSECMQRIFWLLRRIKPKGVFTDSGIYSQSSRVCDIFYKTFKPYFPGPQKQHITQDEYLDRTLTMAGIQKKKMARQGRRTF
jgi:hypothetical protein